MESRLFVVLGILVATGCSLLPGAGREPAGAQPAKLLFSNPRQSAAAAAPVTVALRREGDMLIARFRVTTGKIAAKPQLEHNEYPYEHDVVELFVRNANSPARGYFEFELSPYNQSLQVNVIEPRQEYYFGVKNGFSHSATATRDGWEAEMKIPLASIGWDGHSPLQLVGNAYAALGEADQRVYWSLFELPVGKPDFHLPAAFRPLLP